MSSLRHRGIKSKELAFLLKVIRIGNLSKMNKYKNLKHEGPPLGAMQIDFSQKFSKIKIKISHRMESWGKNKESIMLI